MKKLPVLFAGVRAWLTRRPDQALIDATEDRMVNGPPLTPEQQKFRTAMKDLFDIVNNSPLKPTVLEMREDDYNDIVKWTGSPSGAGQVE